MVARDKKEIHEIVREHYGEIAQQAAKEKMPVSECGCSSSSCCSSEPVGDTLTRFDYQTDEISDLPDSVTDMSLGCGNPIAIAELKRGEVVLDLGSGGGIDCFLAAKQVGESGRVIGLDMTPKMLDLARANAKKQGLKNVEFRYGYMEDIPLPDISVDSVISNCVINLSPDKAQVFREVFRVLKTGGRLNVSDIVITGKLPEFLRVQADAWAGCVAGAMKEEEYLKLMREAGFEQIDVVKTSYYPLSDMDQINEHIEELNAEGLTLEDVDKMVASITYRAVKE